MYEKPNTISNPISIPISIPVHSKSESNYNQYSINNIRFDPTQNSPPSLWKMRLNKRIGETHLKHICKNNSM